MIPHKKSKNHRTLTAEQKEHNHRVNSTPVRVEHSIGFCCKLVTQKYQFSQEQEVTE